MLPAGAARCSAFARHHVDRNHIPDAAMTLAVDALYADGPLTTNIVALAREGNHRIAAMATEPAQQAGGGCRRGRGFIRITPPAPGQQPASTPTMTTGWPAFLAGRLQPGQPARAHRRPAVWPRPFRTISRPCSRWRADARGADSRALPGWPHCLGKGTVAAAVAEKLGYHFLDSGAMYRISALAAIRAGLEISPAHESAIATLARTPPARALPTAGSGWVRTMCRTPSAPKRPA